MSRSVIAALGVVALLAGAGGGWLVGKAERASSEDAARTERIAYEAAVEGAREAALGGALKEGTEEGIRSGERSGLRAGKAAGIEAGAADAESTLADQAIAAAEAAEQAAAEERAERLSNCGAPLFPDDSCPTDEEIARANAAESLCGPGTPEGRAEAAELGITC